MNILCDLDGTLANIEHRLHYIRTPGQKKDWDSFFKACVGDEPIWQTIQVIEALHEAGHTIWIVSGRSDVVRIHTQEWLDSFCINFYAHLIMRTAGDYTPDDQLKESWIEQYGWTPDNTLCVFDDRKRIVDMWRRNGFTTYQVADGDF